MKNILELLINEIDIAPELLAIQSEMPIDPNDYKRLKDSIETDGQRDPVKGYYGKNGRFKILSGVNRLKACKETGKETVLIEPVDIPKKNRQDFAISENLDRRHFTTAQKSKVIELLLKNNPDRSNRQIAERAGVDHKTVEKKRKALVSGGEIPHLNKTIGRDGKEQKTRELKIKPQPIPPNNQGKSPQPTTIDETTEKEQLKVDIYKTLHTLTLSQLEQVKLYIVDMKGS